MVDAIQLRNIFPLMTDATNAEEKYYTRMHDNHEALMKVGHHLWCFPINRLAELVSVLDPLSPVLSKSSIASIAMYVFHIPYFDANDQVKTIKEMQTFFKLTVDQFILSNEQFKNVVRAASEGSIQDIAEAKAATLSELYYLINNIRYALAPVIVSNMELVRPQVVPVYSHPVHKLYTKSDIDAGSIIGDGSDVQYGNGLISSNDISGLLIKLKTIYMRAAYLQLIQTLSQLAEKKSYQTITFRQDELTSVIEQIKKLSSDTYRQLKLEDELISKMCYNIIKIIDPTADMAKTMEALSLDIGSYPAQAYALERRVMK